MGDVDADGRGSATSRRTATPPPPPCPGPGRWPTATSWTYDSEVELSASTTSGRSAGPTRWSSRASTPPRCSTSPRSAAGAATSSAPAASKLVTERPVVRVGIDRSQVPPAAPATSAAAARRSWSASTPRRTRRRWRPPARRRSSRRSSTARTTCRPRSRSGYEAHRRAPCCIPDELPLAPTRDFAAPILGTVGAGHRRDDQGRPRALPGRRRGRALRPAGALRRAAAGQRRASWSTRWAPTARSARSSAIDGSAASRCELTLDVDLQTAAESLLADVGPASALVAIRPSDGAILAAANGPGNDGQNLATFGQYAPGSTFKSVSSLALLRAGLKPAPRSPCTTSVNVDGKRFENYDDYPAGGLGRIPFRTAVANSCNTAFISERGRLGDRDLRRRRGLAGSRRRPRPRLPGLLRQRRRRRRPRPSARRRPDRPGHRAGLADGDGDRDRLGAEGKIVVPRLVDEVDVAPPEGVEPRPPAEAAQLRGCCAASSPTAAAAGSPTCPARR